jgi:hypothetical protein
MVLHETTLLLLLTLISGIHSSWPLIATIANAPLHLQGNPFFRDIIAYFSTLEADLIPVQGHLAYYRVLLWHHCMEIVLTELAELAADGTFESCPT